MAEFPYSKMKTSFHCFLVNKFHRLLIFVGDGAQAESCLGKPVPKLSSRRETAEKHVPEAEGVGVDGCSLGSKTSARRACNPAALTVADQELVQLPSRQKDLAMSWCSVTLSPSRAP